MVDIPFVDYLKLEYAEAGQFMRHYSTVRLLVSTFLFGVAFTILKDKGTSRELIWIRLSGSIWLVSLFFLYLFTILEKREFLYAKAVRGLIVSKTVRIVAGGGAAHPPATVDIVPRRGSYWSNHVWRFWRAFSDVPFLIALVGTAVFLVLIVGWLFTQSPPPSWRSVLNPFGP